VDEHDGGVAGTRLFRQQRAGNAQTKCENAKVTTAVEELESEAQARGCYGSSESANRQKVRTQKSPDCCELKAPKRSRREAVTAAASRQIDGNRRGAGITRLLRASQRREAKRGCFGSSDEHLGSVKQTRVTTTTLRKSKTLRVKRNCEGMWQATVVAVELLGAQQLVLGTDDGYVEGNSGPRFSLMSRMWSVWLSMRPPPRFHACVKPGE
jgi:hypothetical protein